MTSPCKKIHKLTRLLAGRGCQAADFAPVYSRSRQDAWGYARNFFEAVRFDLIMEALSDVAVDKALEIGCAEGHLTRRLASHVRRLTACDIVEEALERAAHFCEDLPNVRFLQADVREGWPDEIFDLLVYSDVLNYFSKREIKRVLRDSARRIHPGGYLLFANTWNKRWRWSTRPSYIIDQLDRERLWETLHQRDYMDADSGRSITIRLFRRLVAAEANDTLPPLKTSGTSGNQPILAS